MTLGLAQRQAALAGAALLAAVIALALTSGSRHHSNLPPAVGSYSGLAGSSGAVTYGKRTACGQVIEPTTEGIASPVLPCGVRLYLNLAGRHVLATVIDRGPYAPGRSLDLTPALARRLGLVGVQRISWSFAGAT